MTTIRVEEKQDAWVDLYFSIDTFASTNSSLGLKDNVFNVRVYGILINDSMQLLVTDEYRFGKQITKFPGGGLHFGESTIDCIRRELKEETGIDTGIIRHFYTTDFFQLSAFHSHQQIISIYYLVHPLHPYHLQVKEKQFDFDVLEEGAQVFRWIRLSDLKKEDFTFAIDQHVALLLENLKLNGDSF